MRPNWFTAFAILAFDAVAGSRVELQQPLFYGTACSDITANVSISKNAKRIDLSFNKFYVEADSASNGGRAATKECEAVIGFKAPHGFAVAVQQVRYHGNYNLPFGSNAHLSGTHYFNGEELGSVSKRFFGHTYSSLELVITIPYHSLIWTPCGEDVQLSSVTTLAVSAKRSLNKASFRIDEQPARRGISYDLIWRSCESSILWDE